MDQILSQLIPTQRVGSDGFNWWVGQVEATAEEDKKNKGGYRYKVRIVGDHPRSDEILPTGDLPWANVMMPVNVPFLPGNTGGAHPQLVKGCWVIGFYMDNDRQKPIIMGSIGQTPGATTVVRNRRPDTEPLTTALPANLDPSTDGRPPAENPEGGEGESNKTTGSLPDGSSNEEGPKVPVPPRMLSGQDDEKWCQSVAEKCDKQNLTDKTKILMGEFLAEIQRNNGNIGTYYVSQVSGSINSGISTARKYVNKFNKVVSHFVAKVKGFIIEKLTNGVKDLIRALLYPSEEGNALTPVTEWFNNLLKDLGCKMADLGDRLARFLTNVLMGLVNQVYRAVACQIDTLVNGIMSKINELMESVLGSILGPLQAILGAIAGPLNILGGAINFVLNLLGISCSGPGNECAKYKQICTDGEKKDKDDEKGDDFLDGLLDNIDNLFPATGADYNQYTCPDAYKGSSLSVTTVGFTGGVPRDGVSVTKKPKFVYTINDIEVEEGDIAVFEVTRTGTIDRASSVKYKTSKKGTAKPDEDYLPESGILGFAPGETVKTISIRTFYSEEKEGSESFYVVLKKNSPLGGVGSLFTKKIGRCTIVERDVKESGPRYNPKDSNPITDLRDAFPSDSVDVPNTGDDTTGGETGDTGDGSGGTGGGGGDGGDGGIGDTDTGTVVVPSYTVVANKTSVNEGDFVEYTISTQNVSNGTYAYYTLSGEIDAEDIIGGEISGEFVINNSEAKVTIGIAEDALDEEEELLTFTVNGTGATVDVLVTPVDENDAPPEDDGEGDVPETVVEEFEVPVVDPAEIITDENGGIIDIPISNPGDPWAEPPYVFVGGEGIGAVATPLLDQDGFITEIRIKASGYGYKLNLASDAGVRCIVDTFTVIKPGQGYTSVPDLYVNGELGIAEAIINDDGFVIGARTLNRELTFEKFPTIEIIGGGGYGAKILPSLRCLDTEALSTIGATKIGTGRYVDCP